MADWPINLQLDTSKGPIFRQVAATIMSDIERGRLRCGERLPSSRALSRQLGLNRSTVVAAYEELQWRGWLTIEPKRGAFVSRPEHQELVPDEAPSDSSAATGYSHEPGFDLPTALEMEEPALRNPNALLLLGGVPDLRLLPHQQLARAYRSALRGAKGRRLIDYANPQGDLGLRQALGELLTRYRGCPAPPEGICVVRGSQQGLYLLARTFLAGKVVATEAYGHPPARRALQLAGAQVQTIPIDGQGLDVDALEALCARTKVRAVYITPHHQCPTGVVLAPARRRQLLELARRRRMLIIEDDYDFEYHYEGRPILPLLSQDDAGVVVYLGTMSKTLAPGIRLGYVVAPPAVVRQIAAYRSYVDSQGDHVVEHAIATLLDEGVVQQHTARTLRVNKKRRDALCYALAQHVPQMEFDVPVGGMAIWAKAPGVDVDAWVQRASAKGVVFQSGQRFDPAGGLREFARLGFAACDEDELDQAARTLARTAPTRL